MTCIRSLIKFKPRMDVTIPILLVQFVNGEKRFNVPSIWVGGWRRQFNTVPRLWDRFVFPYFERLVHEVVGDAV